mmetsp:Transcript_1921/g.5621  ORF Transcript_1921/g.5621 Transcript_1921/m.5621 type:complete len:283 (+) Transcript_1921:1594-2442(+)
MHSTTCQIIQAPALCCALHIAFCLWGLMEWLHKCKGRQNWSPKQWIGALHSFIKFISCASGTVLVTIHRPNCSTIHADTFRTRNTLALPNPGAATCNVPDDSISWMPVRLSARWASMLSPSGFSPCTPKCPASIRRSMSKLMTYFTMSYWSCVQLSFVTRKDLGCTHLMRSSISCTMCLDCSSKCISWVCFIVTAQDRKKLRRSSSEMRCSSHLSRELPATRHRQWWMIPACRCMNSAPPPAGECPPDTESTICCRSIAKAFLWMLRLCWCNTAEYTTSWCA